MGIKQSSNHIFMIEPKTFFMNPETLASNHYQDGDDENPELITAQAKVEFFALKNAIEQNGVTVTSMLGSELCPDHIFPNWFITFEDKTAQLFSMCAPNRRLEKTPEMVAFLKEHYSLTGDLSNFENENIFLESTSSMVFDRVNKIVYATPSPRTNEELLRTWCADNGFKLVCFETESHTGEAIYHTDVLMYVGTSVIGICYEVIKEEYRDMVKEHVEKYHDVLEITKDQILDFCGNSLEARDENDNLYLIMSSRAFHAHTEDQRKKLAQHFTEVIHADIPTIERYGGGSARCMLSELF